MEIKEHIDWQEYIRLNNAKIIEWMSSAASVFLKYGFCRSKDIDDFRIVIGDMHDLADPAYKSKSVVLELDQRNNHMISLLRCWYGNNAFFINMYKSGVRESVKDLKSSLVKLGEFYLQKSKIMFNKPCVVLDGDKVDSLRVFATIFTDLADNVEATLNLIESYYQKLYNYNVSNISAKNDQENEVDKELCLGMGFKLLEKPINSIQTELQLINELGSGLLHHINKLESTLQIIQFNNTNNTNSWDDLLSLDCLKSECMNLINLKFPKSDDVSKWEISRIRLSYSIFTISQEFANIAAKCESVFKTETNKKYETVLAENVKRRIVFELYKNGCTKTQADRACEALIYYLSTHKIAPTGMITAELTDIDANLTSIVLEKLKEILPSSNMMYIESAEKNENIETSKRLSNSFKGFVNVSVCLLIISILFASCGYKTNPISEVVGKKVQIQFHEKNAKKTK